MARNRTQAQRDRAAQARLRAAKQPAGSLTGAEYRWRKYKGSQLGLSKGQAAGHPHKGEQSATQLRAAGELAPVEATTVRLPRATQHVALPGGKGDIYNTQSKTLTRQLLRKAARDGKRVTVRITATDGIKTRTRTIDGRSGVATDHRERTIAAGGTATPHHDAQILAKPQLFITKDPVALSGPAPGLDPLDLLDYLDSYDDWDDAWLDQWDEAPS